MMTTPTKELCERLSHMEGMRRIGPLIAEARSTIEAQAEHIQKQALEYISLFDQCSEAQDRVKELEAKCALLSQSLEQEKTRSAALEAGLTDGVTDDMAVLQSRVEELEAQLRERSEPGVWETEQKGFTKNAAVAKWWRDAGLSVIEYYAHPPAAAASEMTPDQREAIEWAAGEAYSHAKIASGGTLMYRRWVLLTDMFRAGLTAKEKGE
jgi:hypothetical protein